MIKNNYQSGFALVILIWILSLLSLMAASFTQTIRREISISQSLKTNASALAIAETWVMISGLMLKHSNPQKRWLGNGSIYHASLNSGEIRVRVISEMGKVDINTAKDEVLKAVINSVVADDKQQTALFDVILDWRDSDDDPRPAGAEYHQYAKNGLEYQPTNQPFQSLEELQLVLGMNNEIFDQLQDFITVYSEKTEVNYGLASEQLLQAILNQYQKQNIQDIELQNQLLNRQKKYQPLEELNDNSEIYTIIVEARVNVQSSAMIEAVIKPQQQQTSLILDWRYGQQRYSLFDDRFKDHVMVFENEFTNND